MIVFLLLLASLTFGLSEYAFAFPSVPSNMVLLSCKPFESAVRLTPHAFTKGFEESVNSAKNALNSLEKARQNALRQNSLLFDAGVNPIGYLILSYDCYHHGQDALRDAIKSVVSSSNVFDSDVEELRHLGEEEFKEVLGEVDEARESIEKRDASTASLGSVFVKALNATHQAVESQILLKHAVSALLGQNGLLEAILLKSKAFKELKEKTLAALVELEENVALTQKDAARLKKQLADEKLFLVPEHAFSLQETRYADSTLSYRFPEKWDRAHALLEESVFHSQRIKRFSPKQKSYLHNSLRLLRLALAEAEEAKELFVSAKEETTALEKSLVLQLSKLRPKVRNADLLEALDKPLPRTLGERVIELSELLALVQKPPSASREALLDLIQRAELDGINVEEEKKKALERLNDDEARAIRNAVIAKARERYVSLESLYERLLPYASLIELPHDSFENGLLKSDTVGKFSKLERQLREAEKAILSKAPAALRKALSDSLHFSVVRERIFLDAPVREVIEVGVENNLRFSGENVLLPLPEFLAEATLREAPDGVTNVRKGLFFEKVDAGEAYSMFFERNRVIARRLHSKDAEVYSNLAQTRRRFEVAFESEEETSVFLEEKLDFEPVDAFSTHPFEYAGVMKAVVAAKKGTNKFVLEYSILKPVEFQKIVQNQSVYYKFKNRLPLALELFKAEFVESFDCPPSSEFKHLGGKAYAAEFSLTLKPFEEKTIVAQLSCQASTAQPSTQQPSSTPTPLFLKQAARWASYSPESAEWLKEAEDALAKNDSSRYAFAVKRLEELHGSFEQSIEAKAKSLCGRCPQPVRGLVQEALSALFLSDFSQAALLLEQAQNISKEEEERARREEQAKEALVEKIKALSVPELEAFERTFSSQSSRKNPRFEEAQQAYRSAKKHFEKLNDVNAPINILEPELKGLSEDRERLNAVLDEIKEEASSSLETARKAQQQFGDSASRLTLEKSEEAFAQGRYAEADSTAKQLSRTLQSVTPAPQTGLVSQSLVPIGLGVVALLALGGLVYYFRFYKPKEPQLDL